MPERYREPHTKGLERYSQTGEARVIGQTVELEGLRKDGRSFPLDLAISEVRLENRILFTGILRDITERKRTEQQQLALIREIEIKA